MKHNLVKLDELFSGYLYEHHQKSLHIFASIMKYVKTLKRFMPWCDASSIESQVLGIWELSKCNIAFELYYVYYVNYI